MDRPTQLWRFMGILEGMNRRGWPSFGRNFDLMSLQIAWSEWPTDKTLQLILGQVTSLRFHYGENIGRHRLVSAAVLLGRHNRSYSITDVDDFAVTIFTDSMVPEFRSFVKPILQSMAATVWNRRTSVDGLNTVDIREVIRRFHDTLDEWEENVYPFSDE
jgi:hypothetical protein